MKRNKRIGVILVLIGILVLLYKDAGFYGWGGYVDKSLENIIISSVIIIIGALMIWKRKR